MKYTWFTLTLLTPFLLQAQNYIADTLFGLNGQVIVTPREEASFAYASALQPDGKLLVTGELMNGTDNTDAFFTYRFDTSGQPDPTFGDTGKVITRLHPLSLNIANTIVLQSDGKILVGGGGNSTAPITLGPDYNLALVRYNANGSLDNSFGNGGIVETDLGTSVEQIRAIAVLNDGSILTDGQNALVKYTANGSLDPSFANGGILIHNLNIYSMLVQPDGKIVSAGYSWDNATGMDFVVLRYLSNGAPDLSFGTNGVVRVDFGSIHDYAYKVHLKTNGNLIVTGSSNAGDSKSKFAAVCLQSSGAINTAWGTQGVSIALPNQRENFLNSSVMLNGSEKLLLCGLSWGQTSVPSRAIVMRIDSLGQFDYGLNASGFINVNGGNVSHFNHILVQPDNKVLVCGTTDLTGYVLMQIWRYKYEPQIPALTTFGETLPGEDAWVISPNPAQKELFLKHAGNTLNRSVLVAISELGGRKVMEKDIAPGDEPRLDISGLSNGTYVVKIRVGSGEPQSGKLIVQH